MADRRGFLATLTAAAMAITLPGIGARAARSDLAERGSALERAGERAGEQLSDLNRQLRRYRRQVAQAQGVPAPDQGAPAGAHGIPVPDRGGDRQ